MRLEADEDRRDLGDWRMKSIVQTAVSGFVGGELKKLRRRRHVSQEHVAVLMSDLGFEWDRSVVAKIESGARRLSVDELAGLCFTLNLRVGTLLPELPL
jgi:transcriptional regulator with XRE-family HTH domain